MRTVVDAVVEQFARHFATSEVAGRTWCGASTRMNLSASRAAA